MFANLLDGVAPSLLFPDSRLSFLSRTIDGELVHRRAVGRHRLTYGGNLRRVTFDVDIAPGAPGRTEAAGFVQDEYDTEHFRAVAAARVDKFGNIAKPFFSPRLALGVKFGPDHIVTGSYSRAFRAPSAVEAFLDQPVVVPVDFSPLAAFRPLLSFLVPPTVTGPTRAAALGALETALDATTAQPFPLHTRAIGGSVPYHSGVARADLIEESVDSYEFSYSGTVGPARTAVGAAVYRSDFADLVGLLEVPPGTDPFTEEHPPPGWLLPPSLLPVLSAFGGSLPRTSLAYENLGGLSQRGLEVWVEQRVGAAASLWGNYSWQDRPTVVEGDNPYPLTRLNLPPAHRLNVGASFNGRRFLGDLTVHHATSAFWSDVLTSDYHGYSPAYTLGERHGGRQVARRALDDARPGEQPAQPHDPAAHLRGPAAAFGDRRAAGLAPVVRRGLPGLQCLAAPGVAPSSSSSSGPRMTRRISAIRRSALCRPARISSRTIATAASRLAAVAAVASSSSVLMTVRRCEVAAATVRTSAITIPAIVAALLVCIVRSPSWRGVLPRRCRSLRDGLPAPEVRPSWRIMRDSASCVRPPVRVTSACSIIAPCDPLPWSFFCRRRVCEAPCPAGTLPFGRAVLPRSSSPRCPYRAACSWCSRS